MTPCRRCGLAPRKPGQGNSLCVECSRRNCHRERRTERRNGSIKAECCVDDIAEKLGISRETVRTDLISAMDKLRAHLLEPEDFRRLFTPRGDVD